MWNSCFTQAQSNVQDLKSGTMHGFTILSGVRCPESVEDTDKEESGKDWELNTQLAGIAARLLLHHGTYATSGLLLITVNQLIPQPFKTSSVSIHVVVSSIHSSHQWAVNWWKDHMDRYHSLLQFDFQFIQTKLYQALQFDTKDTISKGDLGLLRWLG